MPAKPTKKMKKTKNKISLRSLTENNRVVFGFSLLLAFVLWCVVSVYASPEVERTITGVPVNIDMTDSTPERLGLMPFGETEFYVDVVVRGPKYQVSEVMFTANDLRVSANLNYVDSAGQKELGLRYEILDSSSDVQVVSISRETISIYFDTLKESTFTLEPDVIFPDGVDPVADGYMLDTPILSASTVTVSGPTTEVNKIRRVVARVENEASLTATTTSPAQIYMLTDTGASPNYCTCSADDVAVTMLVKKIVTLPVSVDFQYQPLDYIDQPLPMTISPETVTVALNADVADSTLSLSAGTIDFSEISNTNNTFTFHTSEIEGAKFLDDSLKTITVHIDASEMSSQEFDVELSSVTSVNLPAGLEVQYPASSSYRVTVIGPQESLEAISASDIYAEADYTGQELSPGTHTVEISFFVRTQNDCWCYGTDDISVEISGEAISTTQSTQVNQAE